MKRLSGIRAPGLSPQAPVYVAVDRQRRRQLLVVLPAGTEPLRTTITHGLGVKTEELRVGGSSVRTYIRMVCLHPAHYSTFSALGANIVAAVAADPVDPKSAVARCLDRWRSFWAVDRSELTLADLGSRAALEPELLGQVKSRFLNGVIVSPWENYE